MIFYWSDYKPINYLDNIWWNCWNNVFIHIFMSGLFLKISQFEMSTFQWDIVKSENRQTVNILNVMCYLFANKSKSIIFVFVKSWKDWRDTWIYWNDRLIYNVSAIFINVCYTLWVIIIMIYLYNVPCVCSFKAYAIIILSLFIFPHVLKKNYSFIK